MTITLLTDSNGKKMGKTAGNAVWLDPNKTTPFDFFQYWRNVGDADVMKCIRMLTFLPLEKINEMDTWKDQKLNEAKEILAFELTQMVHGTEEATKAMEASRALFGAGENAANMPEMTVSDEDFRDDAMDVVSMVVKAGLSSTRSEARRNVEQGGVEVAGEKVTDVKATFPKASFEGDGIVVKRGKKKFVRLHL